MKATALLISLVLLAAACTRGGELGAPDDADTLLSRNVRSIAQLKSLCRDEPVRITADTRIEGIVTGNDSYGEFPKSLVIEDSTGGIRIAIDRTRLYRLFPLFDRCRVECTGLTLASYGGTIWLGSRPDGTYGVGRIAGTDIDRYLTRLDNARRPAPLRLTLARLAAHHIGRYVRIDGLTFAGDAGRSWCDRDPETGRTLSTDRTARDGEGRTLVVRTDAACLYADEPIPHGTGSLCGILETFGGTLQLRVTRHEIYF